MHRMAHDVVELGATHHDIVVLPEHCRPILQHQMVRKINYDMLGICTNNI